MSEAALPGDAVAALASPEVQRQAAHMAQDAFTRVFRLSIEAGVGELDDAVGEIARRSANWSRAAGDADAQSLRLAMLISGMDQWGLAYTQAFDLTAIPGLSALIGLLGAGQNAQQDARLGEQFAAIEAQEGNAIDFKMELRRTIHLALWHALSVLEEDDSAAVAEGERIAATLAGLLLALDRRMPALGWRLIADTLAHIQVRCLTTTLGEAARERTQTLFATVREGMPAERGSAVFALANQAAVSWQRATRDAASVRTGSVH